MGMERAGAGCVAQCARGLLTATVSSRERRHGNPCMARAFRERVMNEPWPDVTGGYNYLGLDRMSYYVNKDAYRRVVSSTAQTLKVSA